MAPITAREQQQIDQANASGRTPVVMVHGLWLLPNSWDSWATFFEEAGYAAVVPGWPGDPESVQEAKANPDLFAGQTLAGVADHYGEVIGKLTKKPAVIGHSFGGMLAQIIAGRGLSAATVSISPAPYRGILPLPFSALRVASIALRNPANRNRGVPLTPEQFRYGFGNAVSVSESRQLYDAYSVPGPGQTLFQAATANLNPGTEAKVDTKNPDRGPMLIVSADHDHTVPWAIANASYNRQRKNPGITEITKFEDRGHSLTIDAGWRDVADTALQFIRRFV
jgi:pimeloyl-ACP methyl ester carboxylesterase